MEFFKTHNKKTDAAPKGTASACEDRYVRISLLVQQGREGLVDQEAEDHVQHSLEEGEGHIEDGQALDEAVGGGENIVLYCS